ncbi:MucB/RseB C-terminal domain-containing protein [Thiothrix lacustris]|uniref:MucB/RseB C-terminal domain-containing protein n=1 Tax=Thiothrix lacustris TaxID=525917 RepID=A0ABY9MNL0_9GAMM|nr:MucB/RseB C-terminal domain-containing protein [Thiothrix lacustris]WML90167.1 MucB/RseB C-terminal domain-containing protein [Thiothrix lacustris]WMP18237.1 MucB/RseB C-terminal domain-containing protein [Thiothrix lacustris]
MPTIKHSVSLAVLVAVLAWSAPSMANEAGDLLAKMRNAVHALNYSGTLVYSQGNELSNYQISHTLENGTEKESVVRLAQGTEAGDENVESFSLAKLQQVQPQAEDVYTLDLGGQEFVANRSCQIVVARPRDGMRYLQRYCIEPDSGMLLKYSLVDRSHRSVEQLMFTALDIVATTSDAVPPIQQAPVAAPAAAMPSKDWIFTSLPVGFQQVQDLQQDGVNGKAPVRQIILSDGMTSVSVFIAPPGALGMLDSMGLSSGAMNIYASEVDQYQITLVGEVPVATLKSISDALQHVH